MKKLSIGFILLLSFLAFVPRVALGDSINYHLKQNTNKRDLERLYEKKLELSDQYKGPNLKCELIREAKSPKKDHCIERFSVFDSTKNTYIIDLQNENFGKYEQNGTACEGNEYILATVDRSRKTHVYNVTDVPPGSTLKYIPETKEMQVISPTKASVEERFKEVLKRKDKLMCLYNKKLKISNDYKDTNIKLQKGKEDRKNFKTGLLYFSVYNRRNYKYIDSNPYKNAIDNKIHVRTFESIIIYDEEDCKEYISRHRRYYFDVTDIPAGSYFTIPQTNEMKVYTPKDDSYKQLIKDKIKDIEDKENELKKNIAAGNMKLMVENLEEFKNNLNKRINLRGSIEFAEEILKQEKDLK